MTVSIGALASTDLEQEIRQASEQGGSALILASGAIGALDTLRSARIGELGSVRYIGRKPPNGWIGSPAEEHIDLNAMTSAQSHFEGSARAAALAYPKNANVAAAVALAGIGFDRTQVELIADPDVTENIHEIHAEGTFGAFSFRIAGKTLPDNPRTSALAAMSVIATLDNLSAAIRF
jgi:aspartate dehydrogenase